MKTYEYFGTHNSSHWWFVTDSSDTAALFLSLLPRSFEAVTTVPEATRIQTLFGYYTHPPDASLVRVQQEYIRQQIVLSEIENNKTHTS